MPHGRLLAVLTVHLAATAAGYVCSDVAMHTWPINPLLEKGHSPLNALMAHVVMQSNQDIRPHGGRQDQLTEGTKTWILKVSIEESLTEL